MRTAVLPSAIHPLRFGRRAPFLLDEPPRTRQMPRDLELFATTFLAGFVFVSVLIA